MINVNERIKEKKADLRTVTECRMTGYKPNEDVKEELGKQVSVK
jgi:hypothetical protein